MNGYILFQSPGGPVQRVEAERSSRNALRRILEDAVPTGHQILGVILGPQDQAILHAVMPRAS